MGAIGTGINVPGSYIDINNSRAINPYATDNFIVVIFGEHPVVAGANTDILYQRVLSEQDAYGKFGISPSYELCRSFFRTLEIGVPVELYCVSKPMEQVATQNIATGIITGAIPSNMKAGTLRVVANGEVAYVNILSTDSATDVITSIETQLASVRSVFDITSADELLICNYHGGSSTLFPNTTGQSKIVIDGYVGGPEFTTVVDPTASINTTLFPLGGVNTGNEIDLADYIAVLPDQVINLFINPYVEATPTQYALLKTEITRRFGATIQLEGHQILTQSGTVGELTTILDDYNDAHCTLWDGGHNRPTPDYLQSSAVAGIMASSLSTDPVVPMQDLSIVGILASPPETQRTFTEMNTLVGEGVAIGKVDTQGNVRTNRITTTHTTTDGLSDTSYRDANTIFTTSYLRQSILRLIAIKYKNYKLANNGTKTAPGQKVVTPQRMEATLLGWFKEMENIAIVEGYAQFKTELSVLRDDIDKTRLNAIIPTDVINQFRIFAGELQFIL